MKIVVAVIAAFILSCGIANAVPTIKDVDPMRAGFTQGADSYSLTPFATTFEARKRAYLEFCAKHSPKSMFGGLCAVQLGVAKGIDDGDVDRHVEELRARMDCADFDAARIIRIIYKNEELHFLTTRQYEALKKALLDFKYWSDEPGPDKMISWTENHMILFHSAEYLAGQLFPNEIFTNNGMSGQWHMEHARPYILQWLDRRARWGFSEWDSNVYYEEDFGAVFNIADFVRDPEISNRATMILDVMFLDIGSDLFYGVYGTSHGRTYFTSVLNGASNSIMTSAKIIWGYGNFTSSGSFGGVSIVTGRYTPPAAIVAVGQNYNLPEYENKERHGFPIEDAPKYGIMFDNFDDLITLWGMGAYTHPLTLEMTLRMADERNLWEHPFFTDAAAARNIPRSQIGKLAKHMSIESDRTILGEVNKITYRTPDYMLSAAQDYRPGLMGNQHHIWQATLSPQAQVFVNNPAVLKVVNGDRTPSFWGGQNRFPRVAQYKNLLISIYNIKDSKALGERALYLFTHAYFPKGAFDQVETRGTWTFARVNDGYIALYSSQPAVWTTDGPEKDREIVAQGARNIWICLMGRKAIDGTFDEFMQKTSAIAPTINGLDIDFTAPGAGRVTFGWTAPLTVDGKQIALRDYPRVQSNFGRSEFNTGVYTVDAGGSRLVLDFNKNTRVESKIQSKKPDTKKKPAKTKKPKP